MGTGGASLLSSPDSFSLIQNRSGCLRYIRRRTFVLQGCNGGKISDFTQTTCTFKTKQCLNSDFSFTVFSISLILTSKSTWLSPRPISIGQLNTLLHLHLRPINHVVFMGSYCFRMGYLVLKGASRLDAFSVYPVRT